MTRWRPPQATSTAIITADGHARLKRELDQLWRELRPQVVKALAAAAAEGDRSENAEYTYRKKQLGEIDRRVRYLSKRLPMLRVSAHAPNDRGAIYFGAWFGIIGGDGATQTLRIVGPDETDAARGWISIDSPMARAVLRRRVEEQFEVELPGGPVQYTIVSIDYDAPVTG